MKLARLGFPALQCRRLRICARRARALAAAMLGTCALAGQAAPVYTLRDLGTLGGTFSNGGALNASGQAVGAATVAGNSQTHAVLFGASGQPNTDLGTLGSHSPYSAAHGINASGQIVGQARVPSTNLDHAVLFGSGGGANLDLGTLGGSRSWAYGINDSGLVVGWSQVTGDTHARATLFSTTGGANLDLGTLGGTYSTAHAVNNLGQIVGSADVVGGNYHATLFNTMGGANLDLGTLGGPLSEAMAANDVGQIVGYSNITDMNSYHATLFSAAGAAPVDMGAMGGIYSLATAINNAGVAVGWAYDPLTGTDAFIWDAALGMRSLETLVADPGEWNLLQGSDINDQGQILALGQSRITGQTHALLLDVASRQPALGVPEPTSLALFGAALLLLHATRQRR